MKKLVPIFLAAAMLFNSCGISKTGSGALIGAGSGAVVGGLIGYLVTGDAKGAAIGAAAGTAVGGGTGAIIGNKMDKKAAELKALEDAQIETIEDANGYKAIKVTFSSGILFPTNGSTLSKAAKADLAKFASEMADLPDTDIAVHGHTDNTGKPEVNDRLSVKRAESVAKYLNENGIVAERMHVEGHSFNEPIADNATAEGRAQNRRVEIFISANEDMIKAAEAEAKN
ncbi:MAG: OmpA family protein [Bacteroidales bacterium]|nr:OmpA family protein [Bacteroidales bacterium]